MFAHCLCSGEQRTVLVLYWQNLEANSPHRSRTPRLCMPGLALRCFFFFMWVLAAAVVATRLLPKRTGGRQKMCIKSVVISNKQQGHITTCDGKPQRATPARPKDFFRRRLNHLTFTRDGLTRTAASLVQLLFKIMSKQRQDGQNRMELVAVRNNKTN